MFGPKIEAALRILEENKTWPDHRFVCWSGGRDSTTVLHLALRVWGVENFIAVFVDTGITMPETLAYIKSVAAAWGLDLRVVKAEKDFWGYAKRNGFPSVKALWCRTHFKLRPLQRFVRQFRGWKVQALGIRRSESSKRMKSEVYKRGRVRDPRVKFCYTLHPIKDWSERDVRSYGRKFGLPENPAYKIFKTSGCYYCPFVQNAKHYLALKAVHPELFSEILEAEKATRSKFLPVKGCSLLDLAEQRTLNVV